MVEHLHGKEETQVQSLVGAPSIQHVAVAFIEYERHAKFVLQSRYFIP